MVPPEPSSQGAFRPVPAAQDGIIDKERNPFGLVGNMASDTDTPKMNTGDIYKDNVSRNSSPHCRGVRFPRDDESSPLVSAPAGGPAMTKLNTEDISEVNDSRNSSPRPGGQRFLRDPRISTGPNSRASSQEPFRLAMPAISPAQLAFSALQYLPVPTLVLNSLKTVVLANDALGRMLGIISDIGVEEDACTTLEKLRGQTLSQVGIDMLQDGHPVWVTWEAFLDTLVDDLGVQAAVPDSRRAVSQCGGDATPTLGPILAPHQRRASSPAKIQNAVVEVVISRKGLGRPKLDHRQRPSEPSDHQAFAKMIISIWEVDDKQTYFSLTFTSTEYAPSSPLPPRKSVAKSSILEAAEKKTIRTPSVVQSNPTSVASSRDSSACSFYSPGAVTMSSSPFPPLGPPSVASQSSTPSVLQKMIRMKDALLDNTQVPIVAMWKDESVTFPNKAARRLFSKDANVDPSSNGFDMLKKWDLWKEDFSERLDYSQYPVEVLLRTETPFEGMRVGIYNEQGEKVVLECLGETLRDEATGEFLAGVVSCRDCTLMAKEITDIKERDEERFKLICDTMPQLVWTTTPDGMHDFFNTRWYSYTGLTPEESLGEGWRLPFHSDDLVESAARWKHSLATGDPYMTEYRCQSKEGEWRWFLGRALAMRNKETGAIEGWFGTCTDVHEGIETKRSAKRTRQQLLSVLSHSHVTIFTADLNRRVTMLEGAMIWDTGADDNQEDKRWFIGENVYKVFNRLTEHMAEGERPDFLHPIEEVLDGNVLDGIGLDEHPFNNRWYRTRFVPIHGKKALDGKTTSETCVEGVIGVIMDVTELRIQKDEAKERLKEKRAAVANEAAAREATRLKSQFLANMSHEIRTPITGVLGMAELLGTMELDKEQREYVGNIQTSATSLLTVINDILDFSKVESGKLQIEEAQFSLSLIVQEVLRMLQFAVQRKNLDLRSDIDGDIKNDMVVIGDPGRVRQIITNLLTNSIKFTHSGYVRFSVCKEKETADCVEIKFVVEDTGVGISDEARKKLFQPFSQGDASTARQFGGTGLGLTICKNLLDLMNGRISLESRVHSGTTATFYIPFNKPPPQRDLQLVQAGAIPDRLQSELSLSCNSSEYDQIASHSPTSDSVLPTNQSPQRRPWTQTPPLNLDQELPRSERAKMHILVVEDNDVNQIIATKTISKLGFQVAAVWNGKEALEYLNGSSHGRNPKPDIILMDVQMPVIDGYKCTHLLRYHNPFKQYVQDVPIVAMTASAIQGDREKCTKAGMDDYLSKPVTMAVLEKMLIRWSLTGRRARPSYAPSVSDCSEQSESCDNAGIPHVGIGEENEPPLADISNSPITPRPLTLNGDRRQEISPFDSPATAELASQMRQAEGEKEWSSKLQETKLIEAAGGPRGYRSSSVVQRPPIGEALTEENINKLKSEKRQPPR